MRAWLIALFLCSCQLPSTFVCHDDTDCVDNGQSGVCASGSCAFPIADSTCPSQLRYAHYSPAALADQCYVPDYCATTRPDGQVGTFCDGLSVFACDDFEGMTFDGAWQQTSSAGSAMTLDKSRACRGTQSVRMDAVAQAGVSGAQASMQRSDNVPNPLYGRAFYYFASPLPADFNNVSIFSFVENSDAFDGTQLVLDDDKVSVNNYLGGKNGNIVASGLTVPADTWVCIEWAMTLTNPGGTINVWFDGQPIQELTLTGTANPSFTFPPMLGITALAYAYSTAVASSPTYTAWVDEVILDSAPIGCQR